MNKKVLIVEDEIKIAQLLSDYLSQSGFECAHLDNGSEFDSTFEFNQPNLVILDIQLPGKNGLDICRDLRKHSTVPIIMLTAKIDEIDRLLGLELGADDYICKPFSPREVVARVKAVLRRFEITKESSQLELGVIRIDNEAHQAFISGNELDLTNLEFDLLHTFVSSPRRAFSRAQLLQQSKGTDYEGYERNIDSHIKNLRKKLRAYTGDQDPFQSIYGVGYRLNSEVFELSLS